MKNKMKGKIFNAQKVQAILAGNATMFREVIKHKDSSQEKCPYQVGQKIFVKEAWGVEKYGEWGEYEDANGEPTRTSICYRSDGDKTPIYSHWNAAKSMPQWASRLTRQIKEIRVERLTDISEEDAIKEGFRAEGEFLNTPDHYEWEGITAAEDFAAVWNATHKKPEEKWEANPWVWCVSFEIINN